MEKEVRSFLYPLFPVLNTHTVFLTSLQFCLPAALVYLLHQITSLFQHNEYVHLIAPDLSKAFDTVRHYSVLSKLSTYPLADCFYNWLADYCLAGNIK